VWAFQLLSERHSFFLSVWRQKGPQHCWETHKMSSFLSTMGNRSCGERMFNFVRNCQTVFQSDGTIFCAHQQWMRVPVSPHPCQQFGIVSILDFDHLNRYIIVSNCKFMFH
jgi:hypothetical protein